MNENEKILKMVKELSWSKGKSLQLKVDFLLEVARALNIKKPWYIGAYKEEGTQLVYYEEGD